MRTGYVYGFVLFVAGAVLAATTSAVVVGGIISGCGIALGFISAGVDL